MMTKEEFEDLKYDQEIEFDEDNIPKGIYSQTTTSDNGKITTVFHLNKDGRPVYSRYLNGVLSYRDVFPNMDSIKEWVGFQRELFVLFCEWMEEYEKRKAKIIDINTAK